jgi:hypothetical protein
MADVMFFLCSTSRGATSSKIRKARTMKPTDHAGATVKAGFVKGHVKLYRKHGKKPSKNKKSRGGVNVASLTKRTKR